MLLVLILKNKHDHATFPLPFQLSVPPFPFKNILQWLPITSQEKKPQLPSTSSKALGDWALPPPVLLTFWGLHCILPTRSHWLPFPRITSSQLWAFTCAASSIQTVLYPLPPPATSLIPRTWVIHDPHSPCSYIYPGMCLLQYNGPLTHTSMS